MNYISSNDFRVGRQRKNAFTLIELLVVIAIIAMLAAVLFPVFARVRENARRSSCMSNMKQIALGTIQYVHDFDDCYPRGGGAVDTSPTAPCQSASDTTTYLLVPESQATVIMPYINSDQVFRCPSDTRVKNVGARIISSYGTNGNMTLRYSPSVAARILRNVHIVDPTRILMWYEDHNLATIPANGSNYRFVDCNNYTSTFQTISTPKRHLEGFNLSFMDGHVKWFKGDFPSGSTQRGISWDPTTVF